MVKLQLRESLPASCGQDSFPLWHGKVATYQGAMRLRPNIMGFRFGMVKLQPEDGAAVICKWPQFPLWHGKVATFGLRLSILLRELVSALAW